MNSVMGWEVKNRGALYPKSVVRPAAVAALAVKQVSLQMCQRLCH